MTCDCNVALSVVNGAGGQQDVGWQLNSLTASTCIAGGTVEAVAKPEVPVKRTGFVMPRAPRVPVAATPKR